MHSGLKTCVVMGALCVLALGLRPAHGDDAEKKAASETTQAFSLRLLLDARRRTPEKQLQLAIDRLLKQQNTDGGWSQTKDMPSDAYATGQALYALSFADVKNDRSEIQRAISFMATSQCEDRSWPMTSRGHPDVKPFTNQVPITYFGTAWATLGLVRWMPAALPKVKVER